VIKDTNFITVMWTWHAISLTLLWYHLNRDRNWQLHSLVSFLPRRKEFLPPLYLTLPTGASLLENSVELATFSDATESGRTCVVWYRRRKAIVSLRGLPAEAGWRQNVGFWFLVSVDRSLVLHQLASRSTILTKYLHCLPSNRYKVEILAGYDCL